MGKISVGSLAKTLGIEPKDAISRLKEIGVDAKTATSQIDESVVARLTAPQPKDTGTNAVRVASNIIRRRAKVLPTTETSVTVVSDSLAPIKQRGKISVGSLAKTLGIEPKDAISRLKEIGVDAKTATSQIDESVVARLTAPHPKDTGTNAVRVASNIIRRRAKVLPTTEIWDTVVTDSPASVQSVTTIAITENEPLADLVKATETTRMGPNTTRILGMMEIPDITDRPARVVVPDSTHVGIPIPILPESSLPAKSAPLKTTPSENNTLISAMEISETNDLVSTSEENLISIKDKIEKYNKTLRSKQKRPSNQDILQLSNLVTALDQNIIQLKQQIDGIKLKYDHVNGDLESSPKQVNLSDIKELIEESISKALQTEKMNLEQKLFERVKEIENKLKHIDEPPEISSLRNRILAAQKNGGNLDKRKFCAPVSPKELVAHLQQREFYISEFLAQELIDKFTNRKIVVLKGVPGTGKSQLAKHLAEIFLPEGTHPKYTQFSVFPEATTHHSLGGLRMINNCFAPHLGWLSDTVIKSIETDGGHWLILDEINRGDISALLAPVLDALTPDQPGFIEHPNLFPQSVNQSGNIPMPGTYRIIGTMNPFDDDVLFAFTHAFNRRIGFVDIPPLLDEDEQAFLDSLAVQRQMEALGIPREELDKFKNDYHINEPIIRIMHTLTAMRELTRREPKHKYYHCEIGTALVLEAARRVCKLCTDDPQRAKSSGDMIADEALHDTILGRMDDFSIQALTALSEIFETSWAPKCSSRINAQLRELNGQG